MKQTRQIQSFKEGSTKWFKSAPNYAQTDIKVDGTAGLLSDVAVCTVGEAKGHGVNLDQEFIETIVAKGNEFSQGIKCRFGHPTMSSEAMGTYLGRFTNFRVTGNKAIADLQLDEVCKKSPSGNLFDYVSEMAAKNPDMFGASIVFTPGRYYRRDENGKKISPWGSSSDPFDEDADDDQTEQNDSPIFIECESLHGADIVDEPAANEGGLFSSARFNSGAFAVRITEFLDANPDIWSFVDKHPEKFKPFLEKYAAYKQRQTTSMSKKLSKKRSLLSRMLSTFFETSEATTTDGNRIKIVMEGTEPAIGDEVYVIAEDGTESVAPDGDHTVSGGDMDGYVFTVSDGKISAIVKPDAVEAPANPPLESQSAKPTPAEEKLQAENDQLKKQFADLQKEFTEFKKKPLVTHTNVAPEGDGNAGADDDKEFSEKPWNKGRKPIQKTA